jgi:DNA invertase Pin-like site-specific DNA recombinase
MKKIIGYGRISTNKQKLDVQEEQLKEYNILYFVGEEISSSVKLEKRKLYSLLNSLEENTTIIVVALDRIARNTMEILEILEICQKRNLIIKTIRENLILERDLKPEQKMILTVLGSIAEMERKTIQNRVKRGLEKTKLKGTKLGRKKGQIVKSKLDKHKKEIMSLLEMKLSVRKIKKILDLKVSVSEQAIGNYIKKHNLKEEIK